MKLGIIFYDVDAAWTVRTIYVFDVSFFRIYSNNHAVNGLRWHRNIVRAAQEVTANAAVNQRIPTILFFVTFRMTSMGVILNVFSLSYLWENQYEKTRD